ncbi:hypothetical protein [Arthrobacter sp. UYCu712]|uniref:hypothetical protein n=1 Tax=Arthrobacter sp. UYCu712 TaxID=3156340 RepID=UPI00339B4CFA
MFEQTDRDNLEKLVNGEAWEGILLNCLNAKIDDLVKASIEGSAYEQRVNEKVDEVVGNLRKAVWNSEETKIMLRNQHRRPTRGAPPSGRPCRSASPRSSACWASCR